MNWRIPLSDVDLGPEEKTAVCRVLDEGWLSMGAVTRKFELEFAAYMGIRNAVAVTNGTAALHLACLALGIGPGDEVIVPSMTFVATAAAVRYTGAKVVFADILGEHDLNISPRSIEQHLTNRTRAVIVVHYGGYACDMEAVRYLAETHGFDLIEDAAHAPGSTLGPRKLGTWGSVGCFSFFPNKNLTTGEGGMLVTEDDAFAERLRRLRSHGMTELTWDRHHGQALSYDVTGPGYNYRMDEIRAAIGLEQLRKLEGNNERRRSLTMLYRRLLQEMTPEVSIPFWGHAGVSSCHLFPMLLPQASSRALFMEGMKSLGIQTSVHYPPVHRLTYYRDTCGDAASSLQATEAVSDREVTLPLYPTLSPADAETVVRAVRSVLNRTAQPPRDR